MLRWWIPSSQPNSRSSLRRLFPWQCLKRKNPWKGDMDSEVATKCCGHEVHLFRSTDYRKFHPITHELAVTSEMECRLARRRAQNSENAENLIKFFLLQSQILINKRQWLRYMNEFLINTCENFSQINSKRMNTECFFFKRYEHSQT